MHPWQLLLLVLSLFKCTPQWAVRYRSSRGEGEMELLLKVTFKVSATSPGSQQLEQILSWVFHALFPPCSYQGWISSHCNLIRVFSGFPVFNFCCCCCFSVAKLCPTLCDFMAAACQASLSFTISQNMLKLLSPGSSIGKESACNAGDPIWIPGLGRSTGEGIGYALQYAWASHSSIPVWRIPWTI